jgi:hypothetical protein
VILDILTTSLGFWGGCSSHKEPQRLSHKGRLTKPGYQCGTSIAQSYGEGRCPCREIKGGQREEKGAGGIQSTRAITSVHKNISISILSMMVAEQTSWQLWLLQALKTLFFYSGFASLPPSLPPSFFPSFFLQCWGSNPQLCLSRQALYH